MSKDFLFKLLLTLSALAVAVMWLLSMFIEELAGFNFMWAVAIVTGVAGALFVLRGLFGGNIVTYKKFFIFFGAGLLILCFLAIINIYTFDSKMILPVIAIIATAALVLSVLAVGGRTWDQGDNKKVGYKNYYQRKKEEEENNK